MTEAVRGQEDSILARLCEKHGVSLELAQELLSIEHEYRTSERRHGIYDRLQEAIEDSLSGGEDGE